MDMIYERIEKTRHYRTRHECDVPWNAVINVIFTAKHKKIGKNLIKFESAGFYVLCKKEECVLKVINAKRK